MQPKDRSPTIERAIRVGFVLDYLPNSEFMSKEAILSRDSYADRWLLALSREGVKATKYVPYRDASSTETHRHRFGHVVKLVSVRHPILPIIPHLRRAAPRNRELDTLSQRIEMLGFSLNLRKQLVLDKIQLVHYMNYLSSSFLFSPIAADGASTVAWWTGGDVPRNALSKWLWFFSLLPALRRAKGVMIGDYPERRKTLSWLLKDEDVKIHPFQLIRVDQDLFHPQSQKEARTRLGMSHTTPEILSVISLIPLPNNDPNERQPFLMLRVLKEALETLGSNQTPRVSIIGMGRGLEALRSLSVQLGIADRVSFLGRVEHDKLPIHYAAADIVFVPYLLESLNETNVLAEAFSCGRTVAAFRRSEGLDLVQPGGYLLSTYPKKGGQELAQVISQRHQLSQKSKEALSLKGQFGLATAGRDIMASYSQIIRS